MMKLFYIISCLLICCQSSSTTQNTKTEKSTLYSREVGPKYGKVEMCIGSFVSALYSIPCVQNAFYEEKIGLGAESTYSETQKSLVKFMTDSFVKMRKNIPKLDLTSDREDIGFKAVDIKLAELVKNAPKRIQNLFFFNLRVEVVKFTEPVSVHRVVQERFHKNVHVDSNLRSVAEQVNYQFSDDLTNNYAQQKLNLSCPVQVRNQVESHPQVFTLFLDRIVQTVPDVLYSFKSNPFTVDKEIVINHVAYILISRIEYNTVTGYYSTVALDIGNSKTYRYDENGNVTEFIDAEPLIDTNSVVLFYIPKANSEALTNALEIKRTKRAHEEIEEPQTDESVKIRSLQKNGSIQEPVNQRFEQEASQNTASTQSVEARPVETSSTETVQETINTSTVQETTVRDSIIQEGECPFYRPNYNVIPHALESFLSMERKLRSKIGVWPAELLDFHAKFSYKIYILGSHQWSFKPGPDGQPYSPLEIFLTCLASNTKVVTSIFESPIARNNMESVDYHLAVALVKMLLGCKNISLEKLVAGLIKHNGPLFNIAIDMNLKDFGFRNAFKLLRTSVKYSLIGTPLRNTIKYHGMLSDNPISIAKAKSFYHIKLNDVIEPREAFIKGIWYDSTEGSDTFNRVRNVLKATSEIVVVEVERWIKRGQRKVFNPKSIKLNSIDYECTGVVTLGERANNFGSFFIDNFSGNTYYRSLIPGMESVSYAAAESNKKYFQDVCEKESALLFFSKKSDQAPEKMFSKQIPNEIFKNALNDLSEELNFKLNY